MKTVVQKIFREQFEDCFDGDVHLGVCFLTAYDQLKSNKKNNVVDLIKTFYYYDIYDLRNLINKNKTASINRAETLQKISTNIEIIGREKIMETINMCYVEFNECSDASAGSYF